MAFPHSTATLLYKYNGSCFTAAASSDLSRGLYTRNLSPFKFVGKEEPNNFDREVGLPRCIKAIWILAERFALPLSRHAELFHDLTSMHQQMAQHSFLQQGDD